MRDAGVVGDPLRRGAGELYGRIEQFRARHCSNDQILGAPFKWGRRSRISTPVSGHWGMLCPACSNGGAKFDSIEHTGSAHMGGPCAEEKAEDVYISLNVTTNMPIQSTSLCKRQHRGFKVCQQCEHTCLAEFECKLSPRAFHAFYHI